jgi:hypothetical protein
MTGARERRKTAPDGAAYLPAGITCGPTDAATANAGQPSRLMLTVPQMTSLASWVRGRLWSRA